MECKCPVPRSKPAGGTVYTPSREHRVYGGMFSRGIAPWKMFQWTFHGYGIAGAEMDTVRDITILQALKIDPEPFNGDVI